MKILFCLPLLCLVDAWSTFHNSDKTYMNFHKQSVQPIKECEDKASSNACEEVKKNCYTSKNIRKYCKKTCGDCRAVSPFSCHFSTHGCCWDNVTTAGPLGKGCPVCKDQSKACAKVGSSICSDKGFWSRCPLTCQVPGCESANCFDEPSQASFCPLFKRDGFCEIDPDLMKGFCKKTCDLCHTDKKINSGSNVPSPGKVSGNEKKSLNDQTKDKASLTASLLEILQNQLEDELKKKEAKKPENKKNDVQSAPAKAEADMGLLNLLLKEKKTD